MPLADRRLGGRLLGDCPQQRDGLRGVQAAGRKGLSDDCQWLGGSGTRSGRSISSVSIVTRNVAIHERIALEAMLHCETPERQSADLTPEGQLDVLKKAQRLTALSPTKGH